RATYRCWKWSSSRLHSIRTGTSSPLPGKTAGKSLSNVKTLSMNWSRAMGSTDYWRRQTPGEPLFPDVLWSRPEQKTTAGKLLVIGGNLHAFAAPAEAYNEAEKAGVGTV